MRLASEFLHEPEFLSLSRDHVHVTDVEHVYYIVPRMDKDRSLVRIIEVENPDTALIFCNTKARVHYVVSRPAALWLRRRRAQLRPLAEGAGEGHGPRAQGQAALPGGHRRGGAGHRHARAVARGPLRAAGGRRSCTSTAPGARAAPAPAAWPSRWWTSWKRWSWNASPSVTTSTWKSGRCPATRTWPPSLPSASPCCWRPACATATSCESSACSALSPWSTSLSESEEGLALLTMLLDDYYQQTLHNPPTLSADADAKPKSGSSKGQGKQRGDRRGDRRGDQRRRRR